jgi:hypothetical protein
MDGKFLTTQLRQLLQEPSSSTFLDDKTSYEYLYDAIVEMNQRTEMFTDSTTITTVANQSEYNLPTDFSGLYQRNNQGDFFIKLSDGTYKYDITPRDYGAVVSTDDTTAVAIPNTFSIKDAIPLSNVTGAVTATSLDVYGECTLNGAGLSNVSVGDYVHNINDDSHGYVVAVTSATQVTTSLFNGTNNHWINGDTYIITPQGRFSIYLAPPSLTSGYTITIPYLKRPAIVSSSYKSYPLSRDYGMAVAKYAAFMYKYRDRDTNFGDVWYKAFDSQCRRAANSMNRAKDKFSFRVNFSKRTLKDRSYR